MLNDAEPPTLIFTYEPENNGTVGDENHVVVKGELPVQVSVGININGTDTDVTEHTTFFRKTCTVCGHPHGQVDTSSDTWTNFVIHVQNGKLTIKKEGCDPNYVQSFLFKVTGDGIDGTLEVVINGNGYVTISDLPAGNYIVTEDTDWSWRYTPASSNPQTTTVKGGEKTEVTFRNTLEEEKWLDGNTSCENRWSGNTVSPVSSSN